MSDVKSPSPIISYFVKEIERDLPAEEKEKLARYSDAIAKTTHHGDFRRAWHCAEWAIRMAEGPSSSHLGHIVKDLKELRKLEKDSVFGADFGLRKDGGMFAPGEDAELQWVDDTVAVARARAERSGWEAVPWEDLLAELLAIAPPDAAA
ncbi:MAG: hypothetical protein ACLQRH_12925 [Acidimicrobiales bacterium]